MAESTLKSKGPAHLVDDGTLKRCSVCQYPFLPDAQPNIKEAFAKHLRIAHKPVQTREDASQAAVQIVREATDESLAFQFLGMSQTAPQGFKVPFWRNFARYNAA